MSSGHSPLYSEVQLVLDPVSKEQTEPIHTVVVDEFVSKTVINYSFGWSVNSARKVNACCTNMRSQAGLQKLHGSGHGAREMAHPLRALALAKDPSLIPSTYIGWLLTS